MNRRRTRTPGVVLVVLGAALATSSAPAHDVVDELQNVPPVASITFSGDAAAGEPIAFDGSGSADPGGSVEAYAWDFADGAHASGRTVSHAWSRPGTYLVTLVVSDDRGAVSEHGIQLVRVRGDAGQPPYGVVDKQLVKIPMRDGTQLSAALWLPDAPGPFPVVMTHANDPAEGTGLAVFARSLVESGFAWLHVTARGRGTSGGLESYLREVVENDGYDAVEWAADQPWSDGHHAFLGGSNYGVRGWHAAAAAPPHLTTASLGNAPLDWYRDAFYPGGIMAGNGALLIAALAALPAAQSQNAERSANAASLATFVPQHPTMDDSWGEWEYHLDEVDVPVLYHVGWNDVFIPRQGFEAYRLALKRTGGKLVVWPGGHGQNYPDPIDPTNLHNFNTSTRLWFEEQMMGVNHGVDDWPPVTTYRLEGGWLGAYRNGLGEWIGRTDWPVPGTEWTRYYLRSTVPGRGGLLSTDAPAAGETPDVAIPAPAGWMDTRFTNFWGHLAGNNIGNRTGDDPWPRYDAANNQEVDDAASLTYVTEQLLADVEMTGPITLTLYVAAPTPDVDVAAQVSDVWPDGHVRFLANGQLRASLRALDADRTMLNGAAEIVRPFYRFTERELLTPGEVYQLVIEIYPTSNLFRAGHRIRLDITTVDVPMGGATGGPTLIFHDDEHPSRLLLPIQPS